jgi:hypothetical protein
MDFAAGSGDRCERTRLLYINYQGMNPRLGLPVDFAASTAYYDGVVNVVGELKSSDFRLSQALANQVVRKGVCGDFILCGLSPPVSADWSLVHRYTF